MRALTNAKRTFLSCLFVLFLFVVQEAAGQAAIQLVSPRDHIEGSFLGNQAVYADAQRIYLASFQGKLFVLARDRWTDFPVLQIIQDTPFPLTAVRGDRTHLYVISGDGNLRVYLKLDPLLLVETIPFRISGYGPLDLGMESSMYLRGRQRWLSMNITSTFWP